jgi:uncharacterized membrane protein
MFRKGSFSLGALKATAVTIGVVSVMVAMGTAKEAAQVSQGAAAYTGQGTKITFAMIPTYVHNFFTTDVSQYDPGKKDVFGGKQEIDQKAIDKAVAKAIKAQGNG